MALPRGKVKHHLVCLITVGIVVHVNAFNVVRSGGILELPQEIQDVDNSLDENGTPAELAGIQTDSDTMCPIVHSVPVDIDIGTKFPELKFNASWITKKYFWLSEDFGFESRYQSHVEEVQRSRRLVKVFILPHSHNDPGWLNTYEQYYYRQTKHILDNVVQKLTELTQMTFVWSEITYLAKWWKEASPLSKERFHKLVEEGRLEIGTGGWVVPDEATSSLYTLLTELTEGQQWVKNHLNITAKYSWAIDPFGHSATHSHLLKQSGMQGMVIQRLHYAWKHWLAQHKTEDFRWRPRWDLEGNHEIPCLTLPYDLYSIKHACGPEPQVCLKFDFRKIQFEYGENYGRMTPISRGNIRQLAEELAVQYQKTASLTNHNVLLIPLGDDFRYDRPLEWDQQYTNYMHLFSYINSHKDKFRMDIRFGTLRDYFEAVTQLSKDDEKRPSLSGDFFPYGDVYVSGQPAYWTGFYGTRPYWKKFHRELENELRSAEILFTYANILAQKSNSFVDIKTLSYKYQDLIMARKEFSVFAHHDGITGTSRTWTMDDYGDKLHTAYLKCISVQQQSLKIIYQRSLARKTLPTMLTKDFMRERFEMLPSKIPIEVFDADAEYATKIMIFNNLAWLRTEMVKLLVKRPVVLVTDSKGAYVPSQINPVFSHDESTNKILISDRMYELVFLANLEPLATSIFKIKATSSNETSDEAGKSGFATVTCKNCVNLNGSHFADGKLPEDYLALENSDNRLNFLKNGLLESIFMKKGNKSVPVEFSVGMYRPTNKQSGAYLLKPMLTPEWKFFQHLDFPKPQVIRLSGPIMSQIVSIHNDRYETIKVNTTLINTATTPEYSAGPEGILIETYVDFSRDYSNRAEVYMRLSTGLNSTTRIQNQEDFIRNATGQDPTLMEAQNNLVMYTDQNGFVYEKRLHVASLGYEGNNYPVTTMAYIQDEEEQMRLSVLVDRTHGFCSMQKGRLETLIERKSLYDDGRGMSEGVTDSKPTVSTYILLLEDLSEKMKARLNKSESFSHWQPTLAAHKASLKQNYPPNLFVFNEPDEIREDEERQLAYLTEEPTISLISSSLPDNAHLLNLRTISSERDDGEEETASASALLNLQYLLDFGDDSNVRRQCNSSVGGRSAETVEVAEADGLPVAVMSNVDNNATQFEKNWILPLRVACVNVTRVTSTSLTGVVDEMSNMTEYGVTWDKNKTQVKSQSSSLLVNFKLHFV